MKQPCHPRQLDKRNRTDSPHLANRPDMAKSRAQYRLIQRPPLRRQFAEYAPGVVVEIVEPGVIIEISIGQDQRRKIDGGEYAQKHHEPENTAAERRVRTPLTAS